MKIHSILLDCMLAIAFCVGLCACGDDNSTTSVEKNGQDSTSDKKEVWDYLNPNVVYSEMTDTRDGQVYKIVTIGTQTWMAENLNYAYLGVKYKSGDYSIHTSDSTSWCFDNGAVEWEGCSQYGRLYTWSAAIDSVAMVNDASNSQICGYGKICSITTPIQGVCPEGWHLPSKTEWDVLITSVGGLDLAGQTLKSISSWCYNLNGLDTYGFSVLPAGHFLGGSYGLFELSCTDASFWTSSEYVNEDYNDGFYSYYLHIGYFGGKPNNVAWLPGSKDYGFSVRCVKD